MRTAGLAVRNGRPVALDAATRLAAILRQLARDGYPDILRVEDG